MILALVIASLYIVYFVYLLLAGAGVTRTSGVLRTAAWKSVVTALIIGVAVGVFAPAVGLQVFLVVMLLSSLMFLPVATLSRARDFVMPSSSALEAVCLNVLVLAVGEPSPTFPIFDLVFQGGYHALLNPFASFMPPWLGMSLSLWPAVLALRLAALGTKASERARYLLIVWVHVMSIIWVLPAAITSLFSFKGESPLKYVELLFACLGLVYVVLTWMTLRDAMSGKRTHLDGEVSLDVTAKLGVARVLAQRMDPGRLPPAALVAAGAVTYLVVWLALMTLLDPQSAASIGFMLVVVGGALVNRGGGKPASDARAPARPAAAWLPSAGALIVLAVFALPLAMASLAARHQGTFLLERAEVRAPRDVRAADASQRLCDFEKAGTWLLDCHRNHSWVLEAVSHPAEVAQPTGFDLDEANEYALEFESRTLHCAQVPAQAAGGEVTMLVVYVPGSTDGSQYAWTQERDATCARVVEVLRPAISGSGPGFGYRGQQLQWLGELR